MDADGLHKKEGSIEQAVFFVSAFVGVVCASVVLTNFDAQLSEKIFCQLPIITFNFVLSHRLLKEA